MGPVSLTWIFCHKREFKQVPMTLKLCEVNPFIIPHNFHMHMPIQNVYSFESDWHLIENSTFWPPFRAPGG